MQALNVEIHLTNGIFRYEAGCEWFYMAWELLISYDRSGQNPTFCPKHLKNSRIILNFEFCFRSGGGARAFAWIFDARGNATECKFWNTCEPTTVIGIRGTTTNNDAALDMFYYVEPSLLRYYPGYFLMSLSSWDFLVNIVHKMVSYLNSAWSDQPFYYADLVTNIQKYIDMYPERGARTVIVGHSLGGALTGVVATELGLPGYGYNAMGLVEEKIIKEAFGYLLSEMRIRVFSGVRGACLIFLFVHSKFEKLRFRSRFATNSWAPWKILLGWNVEEKFGKQNFRLPRRMRTYLGSCG